MSCRRRNNATLHQTGPCFTVSLVYSARKESPAVWPVYFINVDVYLRCYGLADTLAFNTILLRWSSRQKHLSCLLLSFVCSWQCSHVAAVLSPDHSPALPRLESLLPRCLTYTSTAKSVWGTHCKPLSLD